MKIWSLHSINSLEYYPVFRRLFLRYPEIQVLLKPKFVILMSLTDPTLENSNHSSSLFRSFLPIVPLTSPKKRRCPTHFAILAEQLKNGSNLISLILTPMILLPGCPHSNILFRNLPKTLACTIWKEMLKKG